MACSLRDVQHCNCQRAAWDQAWQAQPGAAVKGAQVIEDTPAGNNNQWRLCSRCGTWYLVQWNARAFAQEVDDGRLWFSDCVLFYTVVYLPRSSICCTSVSESRDPGQMAVPRAVGSGALQCVNGMVPFQVGSRQLSFHSTEITSTLIDRCNLHAMGAGCKFNSCSFLGHCKAAPPTCRCWRCCRQTTNSAAHSIQLCIFGPKGIRTTKGGQYQLKCFYWTRSLSQQ